METSCIKRVAWSCYETVLDKNWIFSPKAFLAPTHEFFADSLLAQRLSAPRAQDKQTGAELQFSGEICVGLG